MPHQQTQSTQVTVNSETTPLNQNNSAQTSAQMDDQTKKVVRKIVIDVVLLACVGFPVLMFFLFGKAYKRGFFCNDESLMHPFHESTVTHEVLYSVGFGLPIISMSVTEFIRWQRNMDPRKEMQLFGREIPFYAQNLYKYFGIFLFGAACSQLTTDIGKYSIGRFRPHFISVCKPQMLDGSTCNDTKNLHSYIEEFTCTNPDSSPRRLKEMRLSFPSGHSSFSMYTMVFAALYLHCRMNWRGSKLLKHFLQFTFIMLAWFTALSRISDYKHHWSDVLSGSLQGLVVCLLIIFGVSDLFKNRANKKELPTYELNNASN